MRAIPIVAAAALLLRARGLQRTTTLAHRAVRGQVPDERALRQLLVWIDRAGRYVPGGSCLAQSLALVWMLRGRGMPAELRIGVADARAFEAHAWVVCEGKELTASGGAHALDAVNG